MIDRYISKKIDLIWQADYRYNLMLKLELLVMCEQSKRGEVPEAAYHTLSKKSKNLKINIRKINEIEMEVKHDIIAFLTFLENELGIEARFLHRGMNASDLIDTICAYQLKEAGLVILDQLEQLISILKNKALEHKNTPILGRSHGMAAEPTSFGLKLLTFFAEFSRHKKTLTDAIKQVGYGKISGAVGTYSNINPEVEEQVLSQLGLGVEPVASQVVARDRHANFFSALALIASSIERLAIEIRHLSRSEVLEVEEFFAKKQKGSSAMPHKKNPILSENITGLARLVRSYSIPSLENIALWHERDISHSSVERIIAPDATNLTSFIILRASNVIKNLVVNKNKMLENLAKANGSYHSQSLLLALTDKGVSRDDGYRIIQSLAKKSVEDQLPLDKLAKDSAELTKFISKNEINQITSLEKHLAQTDLIFNRTFKEYEA